MLKQTFQTLLQRPMTRRDFLRNIGLVAVSLLGISSALKVLMHSEMSYKVAPAKPQQGFGDGRYGS